MRKSTRTNKVRRFHDENQSLQKETKMVCTIIEMFIMAKYNGVIDDFTMDEVKLIAKQQEAKGKFDYKKGAFTSDSNKAVLDYFDSKGIEYTCETTRDDTVALEWISRGWAVGIGIMANKLFFDDRKDGKIDLEDYSKYKGKIGHMTTFIKWFTGGDTGKEFCLDSTFVTSSVYECDIKKVLQELDQPTKYLIY